MSKRNKSSRQKTTQNQLPPQFKRSGLVEKLHPQVIAIALAFLFIVGAIADGFGAWNGVKEWVAGIVQAPATPNATHPSNTNAIEATPVPAPILSSPAAMTCINSGHALRVANGSGGRVNCLWTDRWLLSAVNDEQGITEYFYDIYDRLIGYTDQQGNLVKIYLSPPTLAP